MRVDIFNRRASQIHSNESLGGSGNRDECAPRARAHVVASSMRERQPLCRGHIPYSTFNPQSQDMSAEEQTVAASEQAEQGDQKISKRCVL